VPSFAHCPASGHRIENVPLSEYQMSHPENPSALILEGEPRHGRSEHFKRRVLIVGRQQPGWPMLFLIEEPTVWILELMLCSEPLFGARCLAKLATVRKAFWNRPMRSHASNHPAPRGNSILQPDRFQKLGFGLRSEAKLFLNETCYLRDNGTLFFGTSICPSILITALRRHCVGSDRPGSTFHLSRRRSA
jgi:hypothetical protein